jgi:hypothetical protein
MPQEELAQEATSRSEELFSRREELFGDRRLAAKAYDYAMLIGAVSGQVDLTRAYERAISQANLMAGASEQLKNAAAFPASVDKTLRSTLVGTSEQTSQTLSEDTTQNVLDKALRQVGETMTQEISRTVMDGLNTLASALRAEVAAGEEEEA